MRTFILYITLVFLAPLALFASSHDQEQTLSIIKPDAVASHYIGNILARFEKSNLQIAGLKMLRLTPEKAGQFYEVHKDRPFYADLVKYMSSGPVVVIVLQGPDAVAKNRQIMGATDPSKALQGTLRADFGKSMTENAVHGSDSLENAQKEIAFFFAKDEIVNPR